ncbi:uncharacterized protein LOC6562804 [Drosophila grimshawi]|uniref:GH10334 n=1 Tax=Drosophila grimshawi TaxID=7222 RepID=B4JA73_DROGR|nr:uncharacterized protein LOC6562804 [Drosophila grimshawi]EDW03747.1 GH10334 [Drosophila grimshawi]
MMKHALLLNTLQAVEMLETAFKETLRTIDDIKVRHWTVSARKKVAEKRQRLFESEIEAAITEPTLHTKNADFSMKRKKCLKKRLRNRNIHKSVKTNQKSGEKPDRNVMCLQTNCFYEFDEAEPNPKIYSVKTRIYQVDSEEELETTSRLNSQDLEQTDSRMGSSCRHP